MSDHLETAITWLKGLSPEAEVTPQERLCLKDFTSSELEQLVVRGYGEKKFRASQLYSWLYIHLAEDLDQMTNLSKAFRHRLAQTATLSPLAHKQSHSSPDGTIKLAFSCQDAAAIETVYIPSEGRNTLCISSQVGCAMGCTFCWTAKMGLRRNLSCGEIVDQVVQTRQRLSQQNGHIGNIVFMGMGEPLHNYDNVVRAVEILTDQKGLDFSKRKVTISTSGLIPAIEKLGQDVDVQLAISLNATTDAQRSSIMPVNDRWNIQTLMDTLRAYPLEKRERITFEYVLIQGLNDSMEDAQRLVDLMRGMRAKVNLIPFNPHPHTPFLPPSEAQIDRFKQHLIDRHISCFRRKTRGQEEMAACGQLGAPGDRPEPPHVRKRLAKFRAQQDLTL